MTKDEKTTCVILGILVLSVIFWLSWRSTPRGDDGPPPRGSWTTGPDVRNVSARDCQGGLRGWPPRSQAGFTMSLPGATSLRPVSTSPSLVPTLRLLSGLLNAMTQYVLGMRQRPTVWQHSGQ